MAVPLAPVPPMDAPLWRRRLGALAERCAAAEAGEEAVLLRAAYTLRAVAPLTDNHGAGSLPDRIVFEEWLHCRAWESAALALLPAGATYMLSGGGNDLAMASVQLSEDGEETVVEAAGSTAALVAALAGALRQAPLGEPSTLFTGEFWDHDLRTTGGAMLH